MWLNPRRVRLGRGPASPQGLEGRRNRQPPALSSRRSASHRSFFDTHFKSQAPGSANLCVSGRIQVRASPQVAATPMNRSVALLTRAAPWIASGCTLMLCIGMTARTAGLEPQTSENAGVRNLAQQSQTGVPRVIFARMAFSAAPRPTAC
jgi:hypothetical protein